MTACFVVLTHMTTIAKHLKCICGLDMVCIISVHMCFYSTVWYIHVNAGKSVRNSVQHYDAPQVLVQQDACVSSLQTPESLHSFNMNFHVVCV